MRLLLTSFLVLLIILTGCGTDNSSQSEHEKIADELDPTRDEGPVRDPAYNDPEENSRLGYVDYTKEQFEQDPERNRIVTMDRNEMADIITRIILRNEGFDEVATLVTGKEVLIAYDINGELEVEEAADIARKSAASIMPRYFNIYVSNNDALIQDIQSLHNSLTTDQDYDNTIQQIIDEMQESEGYGEYE